ncbi:hypothetical protein D3C76_1599030 [compost metagenome]
MMEDRIENAIDQALESIAPQLYMLSIGAGSVLAAAGAALLLTGKDSGNKKRRSNIGLCCVGIGILAVGSGLVQLI